MKVMITGGAGFIGTNLALALSAAEHEIVILDNFVKEGSRENRQVLLDRPRIKVLEQDITGPLEESWGAQCIVHLAANVDAQKAFADPRMDLTVNGLGTLNVLELARRNGNIPVLYASTCKVYSTKINTLTLDEKDTRYAFRDIKGIAEDYPVDAECRFGHAPYGCSKYTGDLYAQEYHELYGCR